MRPETFALRALALAPALALLACGSSTPEPAAPEAAGGNPASMAEPGAPGAAEPGADGAAGDAAGSAGSAGDAGDAGDAGSAGSAAEAGGGAAPAEPVDKNISGQLSQSDIQKLVEKNLQHFDPCYSLASGGEKKKFEVTVTVKATLGPTGKVNVTEVTKSTSKDKKVDECVASAFKKIKFPPPEGGATSVIHFPMKLEGEIQ